MTAEGDNDEAVRAAHRGSWRSRLAPGAGAIVALGWLVVLTLIAVVASVAATRNPIAQDLSHPYAGISRAHWLGTDDLGRDVFSRLVYGTRISMRVSLEAVGLAFAVALPVGLLSGYVGGRIDNVVMRLMDGGLSFPPLVLALAVVGVLGPGVNHVALAIAVVLVPSFARLIRAQTLAVREETFVEASHALGTRPAAIITRRILPNVLAAVIVQVSLALGGALLAEAGLSFLGLGALPPQASWGSMLREAYDTGLFTHPWSLVVPGAAIASAVLAFNTLGDGLAAALGRTPRRRLRRATGQGRSRGLTVVCRPADGARARSSPSGLLLCVEGLSIDIDTLHGPVRVVDDVTLGVAQGRILGLVGESGSGKSLTALAIMRLLGSPPATIVGGTVEFAGRDLLSAGFDEMRRLRGNEISMIFQDPMTSLNPARRVGDQIVEAIRLHEDIARPVARRRAVELLTTVGMPDPADRAHAFPHQLSGGMRQRAMIAMALSCHPRLLIADEPTTALDATIQAEILDVLRRLQHDEGMAVIFVTHDLGAVADLCDDVAVMYAGQIVETATADDVFARPAHPYTEALLAASPSAGRDGAALATIPGQVPAIDRMPPGCRFSPRCPYAVDRCGLTPPPVADLGGHLHRCLRATELTLRGAE